MESIRGSFDDAVTGIAQATGQRLGKRQVEALAARAAVDIDAFYPHPHPPTRGRDRRRRARTLLRRQGHRDARRRAPPGLVASVVDNAASVVAQIFTEAQRRDPTHTRTPVALVDGNNHQINRITAEARARDVPVTIIIDFIHVLEYLWKAAWSFHPEADPAAETWVRRHAATILAGNPTRVARSIRRQATKDGDGPGGPLPVDENGGARVAR